MIKVTQLDHLVLTVRDVKATCNFYTRLLGMKVVDFESGRKALRFGDQKINLHQFGREYQPHAKYPNPGSADLCFLTDMKMGEIVEHLVENQIAVIHGPVHRTGARWPVVSVYIKDPDENLIEIATRLTTSTTNQNNAA